jgi:hypothetical protein
MCHTSVLSVIDDKSWQYSYIAARTMPNLKDRKNKDHPAKEQTEKYMEGTLTI